MRKGDVAVFNNNYGKQYNVDPIRLTKRPKAGPTTY